MIDESVLTPAGRVWHRISWVAAGGLIITSDLLWDWRAAVLTTVTLWVGILLGFFVSAKLVNDKMREILEVQNDVVSRINVHTHAIARRN